MHFALLGNHPDGLAITRALVASGRHDVVAYSGPPIGAQELDRQGLAVRTVGDPEEILADPAVAMVVVASAPAIRPAQLRRALQSERHVLCVHPADHTPDTAYEAAMIQGDSGKVLLPLMTEAFHPGVIRLAQLVQTESSQHGAWRLVALEQWAPTGVLIPNDSAHSQPSFAGWDILRLVGGEIAEVSAFARSEEVDPGEPLLFSGRYAQGTLFQAALVPGQREARWWLAAVGSHSQVELLFPRGWPGPARLSWRGEDGCLGEETWESWDPWPAWVGVFETAVTRAEAGNRENSRAIRPAWLDEIRCLELDDAARRSVERRKVSALDYQQATEEVGFKGTMTLVGCGLLWGMLLLVILSAWVPRLGWLVLPLLAGFLILQLLRWAIPSS
jgi:hypothetical protein